MPETYPSVRDLAVLQQAMQMVLSSFDGETVLHHILLISRNYFGATGSAVYLVESGSGDLICQARSASAPVAPAGRVPVRKDTVAGWAAFTRSPLYIPDLTKEPRHTMQAAGVGSVLALPLLVRDRLIGVLEIGSEQPDAFPADVISLLSVFTGQAAVAIENANLQSTDLRRVRQIEIINLIARTAAAAHDQEQFFTMLAELLSDTFDGTMIAVVLYSAEGHITVPAHAGTQAVDLERFVASRQRGVIAEAFATRTLAGMSEVNYDSPRSTCFADSGSEICVPLVSLGEVLGAIVLAHQHPNVFTAEDRIIAQAAADVCATAAKNVQLAEELRRVTNLDPLTGAYNQRYLQTALGQEISRSRRHHKVFGLIMLDLRDFRKVNTQVGLEAGDNLLRRVAQGLSSAVRKNDLVCRYVADRFVLLLPELNAEGLVVVLGKLQNAVHEIEIPYPDGPARLAGTWAAVQYPADATTEIELMKLLRSRLDDAKGQAALPGA